MMFSAAKAVFAILVGYLALVGLTQICVTIARWFAAAGEMEGCWLVVVAKEKDQGIEMRLRQAHSQTASSPALGGVRLAVVDAGADGETAQICRCFCQEKNLPFLQPQELPALLAGTDSSAKAQPKTPGTHCRPAEP